MVESTFARSSRDVPHFHDSTSSPPLRRSPHLPRAAAAAAAAAAARRSNYGDDDDVDDYWRPNHADV